MIAIYFKEIRGFFTSASGYLIIGLFLIINSLFLWTIDSQFNILNNGYANLDAFFLFSPIIFLVFIPAICMRMFSEEYQNGTIELLLTKPISISEIIISKFLATCSLIFIAIIPTISYIFSLNLLIESNSTIDFAAIIGSYIGLFMLSFSFASIGLFCSSLTSNQIAAFLISVTLNLIFFYGFEIISKTEIPASISLFLENLSISTHYFMLSKGVISLVDIIYFITICWIFIKSTEQIILNRLNH